MRKHKLVLFIIVSGLAAIAYFTLAAGGEKLSNSPQKESKPSTPQNPAVKQAHTPDPEELENVVSLGYTNWSTAETDVQKNGVVRFEPQKAFGGINLYNSRNLSQADLLDMKGNIVHSWAMPNAENKSWHTIEIINGGDLLAIVKDQELVRLDANSNVQWIYKARVHHDIAVSPTGLIYVPTRNTEMWTTHAEMIPVVKEYITVLKGNGAFVKRIDLFGVLSPLVSEEKISKIRSWAGKENLVQRLKTKTGKNASWWEDKKPDVFHLNSIELITRDYTGVAIPGDILISIRQLNLIGIFRESTGKLVWSWGPGEIQCQHHPTLLENGNILLFDNGCHRGFSRVLEVDPRSKKIVWEYSRPGEFFSHRGGSAQRFANRNTLITESDRGRVFEVTRDGTIVWEFLNPDIQSKKRRAIIYRMIRLPEKTLISKHSSNEPTKQGIQ